MIYLSVGSRQQRVIILDSHNLDALKEGKPTSSPDKHVLIAYTPDIPWLTDQLIKMVPDLDPQKLQDLLNEGLKRPIAPVGPQHPHIDVLKGTGPSHD
jgi:hypothetical protein